MRYELWDGKTGNILGAYATEVDALRDVARDLREYGSVAMEGCGLLWDDERGGGGLVADGPALIARALAAFPDDRIQRASA